MLPSQMQSIQVLEGQLVVEHHSRFAIVASRFNHFVVEKLQEGAMDAFLRHGAKSDQISLFLVPGCFEVPLVVSQIAKSKKWNGIVALGAIIRGATPHFDYVAGEAVKGISNVSIDTEVPVGFGILTTDSIEQAIERAGTKHGNKGWDAAVSVIEMVSLQKVIVQAGYVNGS